MIWELVSAAGPSRGHDLIFSPRPSPAHWGHRSWSSPGGRAPAHPVQWVLHGAGGDPGSDSLTDARDGPPVFLREMGGEDKGHLGVTQELAQAWTSDSTSHVSRLLFSRMRFHTSRAFSGPEGPRGPGQSSPPSPLPSVPPCPGSPVLLTCQVGARRPQASACTYLAPRCRVNQTRLCQGHVLCEGGAWGHHSRGVRAALSCGPRTGLT